MNEFYTHINKRLYYITVIIVIFLLITGILVKNPFLREVNAGYIIQIVLAFILTICLLLYPKYVTHYLRVIITITGAAYFYVLFFLYPETWSTFIFLCLIPASAIMFFDSKLFYFSIALNSITIILLFGYIAFVDKGSLYPYIKQDIIGNVINFIGSQGILSFIFYLSHGRIKKQQLYYEQIQQSERLKTTGQLAAAVAHEIRNPLTVVKGFLQLYKDDPEVNNDKKGHFTLMIDELNTAEQVISQFLAVAKPTKELETETVNVKSVLQSVTDLLLSYGLLHDKKIELEMIEDCYIAANNIEMKQLLINIIKNAIEASKEGDSVYIVAGRKKDAVEIKVIDYGTGMTEEEVNSLGTPFYSLKSKGTGLGMMICFNIAAKYKGTIRFQSAKGKGTTVTISFPAIK
ncbi:two-component sensor histidine kinase [Bacillus sp. 7586-K]|nr:two-component sensor histidine kinase [Bacillus sp. 7586-K]